MDGTLLRFAAVVDAVVRLREMSADFNLTMNVSMV